MPNKTSKRPKHASRRKTAAKASEYVDFPRSSMANSRAAKEEYLENPVQSNADRDEIRVIKLSNGLTAMLISTIENNLEDKKVYTNDTDNDAEAQGTQDQTAPAKGKNDFEWFGAWASKAEKNPTYVACYLSINVGDFSDPLHVPFVSEVLSRAILQSSKKYTQNESFIKFMEGKGYFFDIRAGNEFTTFSFIVPIFDVCDAIDRFTSCFVDSRLKPETISTERRNVGEKHVLQIAARQCFRDPREFLIHDIASKTKTHPKYEIAKWLPQNFCKKGQEFSEEVQKFMKRHYSAQRMTVILQTEMPLDSLEKCVRRYFAKIPNNDLPPADLRSYNYDQCFDIQKFNLLYVCGPKHPNQTQIVFDWLMPPAQRLYRNKPHKYISWLLRNEMPGSLLHYLRQKRWCTAIESGIQEKQFENNSIYSFFTLSLKPTPAGIADFKNVIDAVFSYVKFLQLEGIQKRLYEEIAQIEKGLFSIRSDHDSLDFHVELCESMHLYPSLDYLTGKVLFYDFDPKSIQTCLDCMSPEKANIKLSVQILRGFIDCWDIIESRHTRLVKAKIPEDWMNGWKMISPLPSFKLPEPNIFCPKDLTLVPVPRNSPQYPVKIHSDSLSEIWYKLDDKYRTPLCIINLYYISHSSIASAEGAVMLDMFVAFLDKILREELLQATCAGTTYEITPGTLGICVQATGFNETIPILMSTIAKYVGNCSDLLSAKELESLKAFVLIRCRTVCQSPDLLAEDVKYSILQSIEWTSVDRLAAISSITLEKFEYFVQHFTDRVYVQSLVQGNIEKTDALNLVKNCLDISKCGPLAPEAIPQRKTHAIPRGAYCCRVQNLIPDMDSSCVKNYYQLGERSIIMTAGIAVLMMILQSSAFAILRKHEGIDSYDVEIIGDFSSDLAGFTLVASAADRPSATDVELGIEEYRRSLCKMVTKLTPIEWENVKESYREYARQTETLDDEENRNWIEVGTRQYIFDRNIREAEIIDRLTTEDLQRLIISLTTSGPNTRKLSIQAVGHTRFEGTRSKMYGVSMPPLNEMKLKYLKDSTTNEEGTDNYYYITDIAAFKRTLRTSAVHMPIS